MSKKKSNLPISRAGAKPRPGRPASAKGKDRKGAEEDKPGKKAWLSEAGLREIVESVVIAFVLAFLFRTFEAEAFVIPTGSMAPTLMGRNKDLVCPKCGYPFQVSASDECDKDTGAENGNQVIGCTCPMCRYTMSIGPNNPTEKTYRSYAGDRILVAKFPYQLEEPERWDVAVFKFPGKARVNFIKRLVGLPGETIRIRHGDIFTKTKSDDRFTIARKPPAKILATLQPVYDNDYVLPQLVRAGWPLRWAAEQPPGGRKSPWQTSEDYRSFTCDGSSKDPAWLCYRHYVPSWDDWDHLQTGSLPPDYRPKAQLISDFLAYNTDEVADEFQFRWAQSFVAARPPRAFQLGLNWVGDLAVECELDVKSDTGDALFQLVEGGRHLNCRIDVGSGKAALSIEGLAGFQPTADTAIKGRGTHRVMFANVDDQLVLWVDGTPHCFSYPSLPWQRPQREDLRPARIGSAGAAMEVRHVKLFRDIYYIGYDSMRDRGEGNMILDFDLLQSPYRDAYGPGGLDEARFRRMVPEVLSDPTQWGMFALSRTFERTLAKGATPGQDQFLMLGDNSAGSMDGRLWGEEFYVRRDLLIGKALVIYWPHGWYIPGTEGTNIWPIVPNFGRFRLVR